MKQLILSFFILTLSACGVIKEACYPTDLHCEFLFGRHNTETKENAQEIDRLISQINTLLITISELSSQITANHEQVSVLETLVYNIQIDLTELELQTYVAEIIDPCGKSSTFDEIILRMSTGELIAYFESGGTRFLTVLTPGIYQTTDLQKCAFTVTLSGEIIYE